MTTTTREEAEDLAESVRIGYVAATRAKDLLVVNASGMGPWEESWLAPVLGALYLEKDRWPTPESYPHLKTQGWATVLDFPADSENAVSVRPGMHRTVGGNQVFWFDPKMLPQVGQTPLGLHRGDMLDGTEPQRQAGLAAGNQWREKRSVLIAAGSQSTVKTVLASKARITPEAEQIECDVIALDSEGQRPSTRSFGSLVHVLLESWDESAMQRIAELHGRRIGATESEVTSAVAVARTAMRHPLLNPARAVIVHREYPISVTLANGEIVEGVIDLAWSDGDSWTVIDYKTGRAEAQYKTQMQLYALALQRATGMPARAVLFEV